MSDMTHESEEWLTVTETAKIFGKSPRQIRRWINDGHLTARETGPYHNSPKLVSRESINELKQKFESE